MLTQVYIEPVPPMIGTHTAGWSQLSEAIATAAPSSATWAEGINVGVWFPLSVPSVCVARRMWWANGATATGNVEAGIYRDGGYKPGAKLIATGSVGQSGTNTIQFSDITDTTLSPGLWWLFISCSSSSSTFFQSNIQTANFDELLRLQQSSIGPGSSPSTATPAESGATRIHLFGFSTTTIT